MSKVIDAQKVQLVYIDKNGNEYTQELVDLISMGTLIDEDGDDMEVIGALITKQ